MTFFNFLSFTVDKLIKNQSEKDLQALFLDRKPFLVLMQADFAFYGWIAEAAHKDENNKWAPLIQSKAYSRQIKSLISPENPYFLPLSREAGVKSGPLN